MREPPLVTLPADMFLLSGDAIVNESMLTGESVPVSKIPIKNEDLAAWMNDGKSYSRLMSLFFKMTTKADIPNLQDPPPTLSASASRRSSS